MFSITYSRGSILSYWCFDIHTVQTHAFTTSFCETRNNEFTNFRLDGRCTFKSLEETRWHVRLEKRWGK